MSTCDPKFTFRCWQYVMPETEVIPLWVARLLQFDGKKVTMDFPEYEWTFEDGDWLVEFAQVTESTEMTGPTYGCYNAAQFKAAFDIVGAPAPAWPFRPT